MDPEASNASSDPSSDTTAAGTTAETPPAPPTATAPAVAPAVALSRTWIRGGLAAGVVAMADYMLLQLLPGPELLLLLLAAAFAPLLAAGAVGLYQVAALHRPGVALQLGTAAVAVAGVVFTLMGLVQLAGRASLASALAAGSEAGAAGRALEAVRRGLDVGWELGFALGAVLVAWALLRHPRFGWLYAVPGILAGLAVMTVAFLAFPEEPTVAGLLDLGPLLALWWLAVTARAILSREWVEERSGANSQPTPS